jgi:hypothetical protein
MDDTVRRDSRRRCLSIPSSGILPGRSFRVHHVDRFKRGSQRLPLLHPHLCTSLYESQRS